MPAVPAPVSASLALELNLPKHLTPTKRLGSGAYGTVFLCENRNTKERCAVKQIKGIQAEGRSTLREASLLAQLRHENLVHLLDFVAVPSPDFDEVLLVVPYLPSDLQKVVRSGQLRHTHIQAVTCQIFRGLAYLHAAGVAHRDLKPANVLLDEKCNVKICDFGLARGDMYEGDEAEDASLALTEYIVTRWYRAPEVMLLPRMYTPTIDLWSVGCIIYEMFLGKPLFPGKNHLDMIKRFTDVVGKPSEVDIAWLPKRCTSRSFLQRCAESARGGAQLGELLGKARCQAPAHTQARVVDLVHQLFSWDPTKRPSASQAQRHDYLRDLLPETPPKAPERFDCAFDRFRRSSKQKNGELVRQRLYFECARSHPEILARDRHLLHARGWAVPTDEAATPPRSRTPPGMDLGKPVRRTESRPSSARNASRKSHQPNAEALSAAAHADRLEMLAHTNSLRSRPNPLLDTFRPPARSLGRFRSNSQGALCFTERAPCTKLVDAATQQIM